MLYKYDKTILQIAREAGIGSTCAYRLASRLRRKPFVFEAVYFTKFPGRPSHTTSNTPLQRAAAVVWEDIGLFIDKIGVEIYSVIITINQAIRSYNFYLGDLYNLNGQPLAYFDRYEDMREWSILYSNSTPESLNDQEMIDAVLKGDAILTAMIKYLKNIISGGFIC